MTKQQHKLKEQINSTGIHQALASMETTLMAYERSENVKSHSYEVRNETRLMRRVLSLLNCQLTDLIQRSTDWENLK